MKNGFFLILGLALVLGSLFLFLKQKTEEVGRVNSVVINNTRINVELAATDAARAQGLSGREHLPEGSGMLFIFETPNIYGFWMKDMKFAIDIIWISEQFRVVDITHELAPVTYPQTFAPKEPVRYVLEVPAGFAKRAGINIGSSVNLD